MKKAFHELTPGEIDQLVTIGTAGAALESITLGLPVCGIENGVVVSKIVGVEAQATKKLHEQLKASTKTH